MLENFITKASFQDEIASVAPKAPNLWRNRHNRVAISPQEESRFRHKVCLDFTTDKLCGVWYTPCSRRNESDCPASVGKFGQFANQ